MLRTQGFEPWKAWQFDLYGGTVLLAARRKADGHVEPDESVLSLLTEDARVGASETPMSSAAFSATHSRGSKGLRHWLLAERAAGNPVVGYGAASRAVALLLSAGVDRSS